MAHDRDKNALTPQRAKLAARDKGNRFWLHEEPKEDLDDWQRQAGMAVWMEKRFAVVMANAFWGKKKQ